MSQRDVKNRITSVQNIRKITRAMEMVAAARLRRAEQRIAALRPYAGAIRRMTRQAAEAAGGEIAKLPILQQHENEELLGRIREGDWSDETQEGVRSGVAEFADDFGYDLDEEGMPSEEGDEEGAPQAAEDEDEEADEDETADEPEREAATA